VRTGKQELFWLRTICLTYNCVLLCVLIVSYCMFLLFFYLFSSVYVCFSVSCCIIMRIKVYIYNIAHGRMASNTLYTPGAATLIFV